MSQTKKQKLEEARTVYLRQLDEQSDCSESDEEKELSDLKVVPLTRSVLQSPRKEQKDDHERVDFESLTTKMNLMMKRMEDQDAKIEAKAALKAAKAAKANAKAESICPVREDEQKCPEPIVKVNKFKGLF
jgi:hypothetical protein